jgi:serine/threonine protein kinase
MNGAVWREKRHARSVRRLDRFRTNRARRTSDARHSAAKNQGRAGVTIAGTARAARSGVSLSSGEVRLQPASGPSAPPGSEPRRVGDPATGDDEHVEYVAFTAESGSVSKMAIVRSRLARVLGRYLLGEPLAAGGMATVHLGRLCGPAGFSRTVAVKRLHAHLAANPEFVHRFVDEARIASRVRHGNVVQTLDVVAIDDELLLVLDYVHGESFARLRRLASAAGTAIPPAVAAGIVGGVLRGLHAAHEAKSAKGAPLELVHRDVSPQNILVGADGVARVLDFGIAKAAGRVADTLTKDLKGKLAYMPPEQVAGAELDRRADLFAVGVVLWEALAGERLFRGEDASTTMHAIHHKTPARLSERELGVTAAVDDVLARALAKKAADRFETADAMARALEAALPPASDREIADWVEEVAGDVLAARLERVAAFEGDDTGGSKARLFAAKTSETATIRRDALVPPPLESVTNEHTTMRASLPTLQIEVAAALAATSQLPGSMAADVASEQRSLHTPLVMVAPADLGSDLPESGATRIEPVERRPRARTPIPMPILPPKRAKRRVVSMIQLAALVILPPLFVAAAITGGRSSSRAAASVGGGGAAATTQVAAASTTAAALPASIVVPSAAAQIQGDRSDAGVEAKTDASASAGTGAGTKPKSEAPPASKPGRKVRPPAHRVPRVTRPLPVAVNR